MGIERLGLTRSTRTLMRKLVQLGVTFPEDGSAYAIYRDRQQPHLNKRAGEAAPTWYLRCNIGHHGLMGGEAWITSWGHEAPAVYASERLRGVASDIPLTWILKQPIEQWSVGKNGENGYLWIDTRELPPH